MSWSTDFDNLPPEWTQVYVYFGGHKEGYYQAVKVGRFSTQNAAAWHPLPDYEPPKPPKPKLPDGYRVNTLGQLVFGSEILAEFGVDGLTFYGVEYLGQANLSIEHVPALTIWLQRSAV